MSTTNKPTLNYHPLGLRIDPPAPQSAEPSGEGTCAVCPFCGSADIEEYDDSDMMTNLARMHCKSCYAFGPQVLSNTQDARAAWNQRAIHPTLRRLLPADTSKE